MEETCDDQLDRRWLLTGDLPCLGCEYNLRGLVGPVVRCPECAHQNDLRQKGLWVSRELPLGVRERGHWPATAVVWSFAVIGAVTLLLVNLDSPEAAVILAAVTIIVVAGWCVTARRWVKSCQRTGWAIGMLALVHVSLWIVPVSMALAVSMVVAASMEIVWPLVLFPLGAAGVIWADKQLKQAEGSPTYRADWRNWRVPTGSTAPREAVDIDFDQTEFGEPTFDGTPFDDADDWRR